MDIQITPWTTADHDAVRAMVAEPLLRQQFDKLIGPNRVESWLLDPFCDPEMRWIARVDGTPVGFAYAFLLPASSPPWAMLRIAVAPAYRRRGIGTRLLQAHLDAIPRRGPTMRELCLSAFEPCPEGGAFARHHGFQQVRTFWVMERQVEGLKAPEWPLGIETRLFDGSDEALFGWNESYNDSFSRHYHFVPSTVEECRAEIVLPDFDPTALLLAYEGTRCVGFCRNEVHASDGEIATLAVTHDWQGRGLGRALLRWGAQWLVDQGALPITLMVDGENEQALRLYRSEGFEISKTRPVWAVNR